jgi:hypothetical protein
VPKPTSPKQISLTDPAARWTAARGGLPVFAYSCNYLIDLEVGIIIDAQAYDPLEPWFDRTWKLGDFELMEQ